VPRPARCVSCIQLGSRQGSMGRFLASVLALAAVAVVGAKKAEGPISHKEAQCIMKDQVLCGIGDSNSRYWMRACRRSKRDARRSRVGRARETVASVCVAPPNGRACAHSGVQLLPRDWKPPLRQVLEARARADEASRKAVCRGIRGIRGTSLGPDCSSTRVEAGRRARLPLGATRRARRYGDSSLPDVDSGWKKAERAPASGPPESRSAVPEV